MKTVIKYPFAGISVLQRVAVATLCVCMLFIAVSGCETKSTVPDEDDDEALKLKFCSFLNTEDIVKTIPLVDKFLSSLSNNLDDAQKLQALTAWLNEQPCIIEASVLCQSCVETNSPMSEIFISFDDDGMTQEFVLDVSMSNPLKAAGYHAPEPLNGINGTIIGCTHCGGLTGLFKKDSLLSLNIPLSAINIDPNRYGIFVLKVGINFVYRIAAVGDEIIPPQKLGCYYSGAPPPPLFFATT